MTKKPMKVTEAINNKLHPKSKLTISDAKAIRDSFKRGVHINEIASMTDVCPHMARDIATGRLFA